MEILVPETVSFKENCTFHSILEKHLVKRRAAFYLKISLPLVRKGYKYIFKLRRNYKTNYEENLEQGIFWFLKERLKTIGLSSNVQFSKIVNSFENLEIPRNGYGRLNYVKNLLSEELGDRIYGVDPVLEDDISVDVHLNDILPSIEYDKKEVTGSHEGSKAYEDKNIPLKVTIFPLSRECLEATENMKDLIILIKLSLPYSIQGGNNGDLWKTPKV